MKRLILLCLLFSGIQIVKAQNLSAFWDQSSVSKVESADLKAADFSLINDGDKLSDKWVTLQKTSQDFNSNIYSSFQATNFDYEDGVAIIITPDLTLNLATNTISEGNEILSYILTKDKKGNWTDYLLNKKNVEIYIITESDDLLKNTKIEIEELKSAFQSSLDDIRKLFSIVNKGAAGAIAGADIRVVRIVLNQTKFKAPSKIKISQNGLATYEDFSLEITNHETNIALFKVGVASSEVNRNNFSIDNQQLIVTLDPEDETEFKENLIAMLEFHLPRDVDRFKPVWYKPWKDAGHRVGVFGGIKIGKDPLNQLFTGVTYAITKDFGIHGGIQWMNEIEPGITDIGDITDFDSAKEFLNRDFGTGKFFWGFNFSPSAILGVVDSKK